MSVTAVVLHDAANMRGFLEFAGDEEGLADTPLHSFPETADVKVQTERHEQKLIPGANAIGFKCVLRFQTYLLL